MLEFKVTQNNNSIENLFCKRFDELTKYPMDNTTSQIFVKLLLSKKSSFVITDKDKPHFYKIMEKRISVNHSFEVDDRILLFLSFICKSVGECVMYIWYLQYKSKIRSINRSGNFTFEDFADIFADGFPSNYGLEKLWEFQKVSPPTIENSDNLLDYTSAGKSLF